MGELRRATKDIRALVGPDARPTIVFDRGGWSPRLFAELVEAGFDILTYRKNPPRAEQASAFSEHTFTDEHGDVHVYELADRNVRIPLQLRPQLLRLPADHAPLRPRPPGRHHHHRC